ncbi:hypothetical protein MMC31_006022 [Peltigera leucophlebia]|nr:hypothetical protein [Peltigera leucophlebia]
MSVDTLTSNHVNYLIWRYLQESGHGEAAVKLQRDWIPDPQTLPFAQYIKTHALVVLVQKGLQYYEIEQSINQNEPRPPSSSLSSLFFGPQSCRATSTLKEDVSEEDGVCALRFSPRTRKHGRESAANGLSLELPATERATKRSRRSNGTEGSIGGDDLDYQSNANAVLANAENMADATASATVNGDNGYLQAEAPPESTSNANSLLEESDNQSQIGGDGGGNMEIDDEDTAATEQDHKDQEQQDEEDEDEDEPSQALVTLTLSTGQSVGVQSDKVVELGSESTTLRVPDKNVLHTAWNPQDPAILATGGIALCRIWTTVTNLYIDILDPTDDSLVTAMAWSPSGDVLAVATRSHTSDWTSMVSLWTKSGKSIAELPAALDMVLIFRWNPSGSHLLAITSSGRGTSALVIWDVQSSQALSPFQLSHVVTDATWSNDRKFLICGHGIIAESIIEGENITGFHSRADVDKDQSWTNLHFDPPTQTLALAAEESAMLGIIDPSGKLHTIIAHDSELITLAFQTHGAQESYQTHSPRLLVTSSLDGDIKIWDSKYPFTTIHSLSLGRSVPAMAIGFSHDGYFVAAANSNHILIWNAKEGGTPKASWSGELDTWQSPANGVDQDSGIGEEDDVTTHSLSWNSDGSKIAYGLGSQIAIIDFQT